MFNKRTILIEIFNLIKIFCWAIILLEINYFVVAFRWCC